MKIWSEQLGKNPSKGKLIGRSIFGNVTVEATGSPTRCHCHVPSAPSTISQGQVQHFSKNPTQESIRIKKVLQVVSDLVSIVIVMSTWIHWILNVIDNYLILLLTCRDFADVWLARKDRMRFGRPILTVCICLHFIAHIDHNWRRGRTSNDSSPMMFKWCWTRKIAEFSGQVWHSIPYWSCMRGRAIYTCFTCFCVCMVHTLGRACHSSMILLVYYS